MASKELFTLQDQRKLLESLALKASIVAARRAAPVLQRQNMTEAERLETDLFEHREVKPQFINDCCFGEDFATWLIQQMTTFPVPASSSAGRFRTTAGDFCPSREVGGGLNAIEIT
jgi:hypothetical protein